MTPDGAPQQDNSLRKYDLSFIKTLEFDINNRFLIGYGTNKFFLLNLKSSQGDVFTID